MSELSNESKALLEREAHLDEATPAELEAMRVRVVAALGAAALPSIPTGHEGGSGSLGQAAVTGVSLKVVGSALIAALGTSALLLSLSDPAGKPGTPERSHSATAAPAPLSTPPAPAVLAPSASASVPEAVSVPKVPEHGTAKPQPSLGPATPTPSRVAPSASEEALLVATAEAQLRGGHPSAALALYEQHLRDYPKGALRQESWVGRIVALCELGRAAETRSEITRLAQRNPGSAALQRIRRACGDEP